MNLPHRSNAAFCVLAVLSGCGQMPHVHEAPGQGVAAVVKAMGTSDMADVVVCTAPAPGVTDYPTAAAFNDTRLGSATPFRRVSEGGALEEYPTHSAASRRIAQLRQQEHTAGEYGFDEGGQPLHPERRWAVGNYVLRLSGHLTRVQAAQYLTALRRTLEQPTPENTFGSIFKEAPCSI